MDPNPAGDEMEANPENPTITLDKIGGGDEVMDTEEIVADSILSKEIPEIDVDLLAELCLSGNEKSKDSQSTEMSLTDVLRKMHGNEVQDLIFSRLSFKSKKNARLVCSDWSEYIDPLLAWRPLFFDEEAEELVEFARAGYPITKLTISKLEEFQYPPEGVGFKSVKSLRFVYFNASCSCHELENATKDPTVDCCKCVVDNDSTRWKGISEENLKMLLKELKDIQEIGLHSRQFSKFKVPSLFRNVELNKLTTLKISALNCEIPGFDVCIDALQNTFPSLTRIEIILFNKEDSDLHDQHPVCYLEVFDFILRHEKTLKDITISFGNLKDEREIPPFAFILFSLPSNYNQEYDAKHQRILKGLEESNLQLDNFNFTPNCYEGISLFVFGSLIISKQSNLTEFEIRNLSVMNFGVWGQIPEALSRCSNTLQKIIIKGCFCPSNGEGVVSFSCRAIESCHSLTVLKIDVCGMKIDNIEVLPRKIVKLSLGLSLAPSDIDFIQNTLLDLEEWKLLQGSSMRDNTVPKVSATMFKSILKSMKKLEALRLLRKTSQWKRIRKIITYTKGLGWFPDDDSKDHVHILVNREDLDVDRL